MSDSSRLSKIIPFSLIGIVTAIAIVVMIVLSPVTTQVSAAQTTPVNPDIRISSIQTDLKDVSDNLPISWTENNGFSDVYTIADSSEWKYLRVIIHAKSTDDVDRYAVAVQLKRNGQVVETISMTDENWKAYDIGDGHLKEYIINTGLSVSMTPGNYQIMVDLYYYT
jgi:hypothetical protein